MDALQGGGTQSGKLYGLPPTGKRIKVPKIGVMCFANGKWKEPGISRTNSG
jgi:predicted ester cyclase